MCVLNLINGSVAFAISRVALLINRNLEEVYCLLYTHTQFFITVGLTIHDLVM